MWQSLKNVYHWITSWVYVIRYGFPARGLKIIGVTGTDGKTTTSHLIYEMLKRSGIRVALISTVAAYIGNEKIDTGFHVTSPDARILQPLLWRIKQRGFTHLVLEVTSHGLDQNRFTGVNFYMGVITNITHEHLDYSGNFARYRDTKAKLIHNTHYSILNKDDDNFEYLKTKSTGRVVGYEKTKIRINNPRLKGEYNKYNVGAAEAVAKVLGVRSQEIEEAVNDFGGVPGRLEEIDLGQKFRAVIDFAHTPNALEKVLTELKVQLPKGRKLIVVFGCAGLRDHTKRPMMGRIATTVADKVIITAEDPRVETLDSIYEQIMSGVEEKHKGKVVREDDRRKAIDLAVSLANPGDIVVATGKGHEKSMCFGTKEFPWSDQEAMEKAIKKVM